jgi:hypothetical protein
MMPFLEYPFQGRLIMYKGNVSAVALTHLVNFLEQSLHREFNKSVNTCFSPLLITGVYTAISHSSSRYPAIQYVHEFNYSMQ